MIFYFKNEFQTDTVIVKSFLEVKKENSITQSWQKGNKTQQRYLNC